MRCKEREREREEIVHVKRKQFSNSCSSVYSFPLLHLCSVQPSWSQRQGVDKTQKEMTIQLERQYGPQQFEQPLRPNRSKGDMARFWAPKEKTTEKTSFFPAFKKAKTPQPQKKMVSFWETQSSHTTSRNLITTSSKSMTSLVDENRGYTPSEVAKDPAKREFLTNLSKKIFSPPNDGKKRQITRSFARVRRLSNLTHSLQPTIYRHLIG